MSGPVKGPYTAKFGEAYTVRGPDGSRLASMSFIDKSSRRDADEVAATCRLFAAAPCLLEALKAMVEGWSGEPAEANSPMGLARAAIAKATAEGTET